MKDNQNPSADHPLVTHADLAMLRDLRENSHGCDRMCEIIDALIAAAEADKPALPEGWYAFESVDAGTYHVFVRGNEVYQRDSSGGTMLHVEGDHWGSVSDYAHRLTPLVTAASLVPEGWHVDEDEEGIGWPTIFDGDGVVVARRTAYTEGFDVLAALVSAAQAERGESR